MDDGHYGVLFSPTWTETKSRAKSEPSKNQRTRSSWNSSIHSPDSRRTKSCRSEIDMTLMSEQNREKLIDAFLPDLRKNHTRMGYLHRVRPFNLNRENLKTVQIRAKSLSYNRDLREHSEMSLGFGRKAANSTTPRPRWAVKPLPVNSANDRLCPDEPPQMVAFVKRQQWNYSDKRVSLDRALPKRSLDKWTYMPDTRISYYFTTRMNDEVLWGDSNFRVCGRNPLALPFKWNLFGSTLTWWFLFFTIAYYKVKFGTFARKIWLWSLLMGVKG